MCEQCRETMLPCGGESLWLDITSDDEIGRQLCLLIKARDDERDAKNADAFKKVESQIRAIGKYLGNNGGFQRMRTVATILLHLLEKSGGRLHGEWDGICGWLW